MASIRLDLFTQMGVIGQINEMVKLKVKQADLSKIMKRLSVREGLPKKLPQFRSMNKWPSPIRKFHDRSSTDNPFSASWESIVASLSSPRKLDQKIKPSSPKKNTDEVNIVFKLAGRTFSRTFKYKDPDSPTKSVKFNLPKRDSFDFGDSSSESISEDGKVNF